MGRGKDEMIRGGNLITSHGWAFFSWRLMHYFVPFFYMDGRLDG